MAISGKFVADFENFYDAVTKAEAKLADFQSGAGKVETSLNKMVDNFSGRKLIQDATLMVEAIDRIGGTSKLTETELAHVASTAAAAADKLRAMGADVPPRMQEIADSMGAAGEATGGFIGWLESLGHSFVAHVAEGVLLRDAIRELITLGKEAFADAGKFEDLAKATGMSIQSIQEFGYVAVEFGLDVETMAKGVEQLSSRLATGNPSAVGAVKLLGLNVKELMAAGPKDLFLQVAEAAGRIEDPVTKAGFVSQVFGEKLGKLLLPLLGELRDKLDEAGKSSAIMADETVKSAHAFETGWARAILVTKALIAEGAIGVVNFFKEANAAIAAQSLAEQGLADNTTALAGATVTATEAARAFVGPLQGGITNAQILAKWLADLKTEGLEPLTDAQKDAIVTAEKHGKSLSEIATRLGVSEAAVKLFTTAQKEGAAGAKAWAEAQANLDAVGATWQDTLAGMNPEMVIAAQEMLKAGASAKDLEVAWGLLPPQLKAIETKTKDETEALRLLDAQLLETTKLWNEYDAVVASDSGSAYDKAGAAIDKWYADTVATMQKEKKDTAEFYDAIAALDDRKWAHLNASLIAADVNSHAHLEQIAIEAESAFQRALAAGTQFTDGYKQKLRDTADVARIAANSFGEALTISVGQMPPKVDALTNSFKGLTVSIAASTEQMRAWNAATAHNANVGQMNGPSNVSGAGSTVGSLAFSTPSFADGSGGFQDFGSGTLAMLHGKEAVIRPSDVGSGGTTVHVYVTQPLGTPTAIAKAIDDALTARQRNTGARF